MKNKIMIAIVMFISIIGVAQNPPTYFTKLSSDKSTMFVIEKAISSKPSIEGRKKNLVEITVWDTIQTYAIQKELRQYMNEKCADSLANNQRTSIILKTTLVQRTQHLFGTDHYVIIAAKLQGNEVILLQENVFIPTDKGYNMACVLGLILLFIARQSYNLSHTGDKKFISMVYLGLAATYFFSTEPPYLSLIDKGIIASIMFLPGFLLLILSKEKTF